MNPLPWWAFLLLQLAIKFGPIWLLKRFPKMPEWLKKIILELEKDLGEATGKPQKKEARNKAIEKCTDANCPVELRDVDDT